MASSLQLRPPAVTIPSVGTRQRTILIDWNTDSRSIPGALFMSIDNGPEQFLSGTPAADLADQRKWRTSGTGVPAPVVLGSSYRFFLRDPRSSLGNPLNQVLLIPDEEAVPLPPLGPAVSAAQRIFGLRVWVGVDTVRFRFRTSQPALVSIEIREIPEIPEEASGEVVAVAFSSGTATVNPLVTRHDVTIARGEPTVSMARRLSQNTEHTFRIVADALPGSPNPSRREVSGRFVTGERNAELFFDRVDVSLDGDPDFLFTGIENDGEFVFSLGLGDADTLGQLGDEIEYSDDNLGSGEGRGVGRSVRVQRIPSTIWVQIVGQELDAQWGGLGPFPFSQGGRVTGSLEVGTLEGITCEESDNLAFAAITQYLDVSDLRDGPPRSIDLRLANSNCVIVFAVLARLVVEARSGRLMEPIVPRGDRRARFPLSPAATLAGAGDRVWLGPAARLELPSEDELRLHRLQLTAGGGLRVSVHGSGSLDPFATDAIDLERPDPAGPLLAVAAQEILHLLEIEPEGALRHRPLVPGGEARGEWRRIADGIACTPAAALSPRGEVDVLVLDRQGRLLASTIPRGQADPGGWRLIGDGFEGPLAAFASPAGSTVIARDCGGLLRALVLDSGSEGSSAWNWSALGSPPAGLLAARWLESGLAVVTVLGEDEQVHLLCWEDFPAAPLEPRWRAIGSFDELLERRFSLSGTPARV